MDESSVIQEVTVTAWCTHPGQDCDMMYTVGTDVFSDVDMI